MFRHRIIDINVSFTTVDGTANEWAKNTAHDDQWAYQIPAEADGSLSNCHMKTCLVLLTNLEVSVP